jgi:ATP phosphoribosyltransferase regulatory subunit
LAAVIHPLPPGTRDVLPDEARELRLLTDRLRGVFEQAGYGEVQTPALEYEDVLQLGDERAAGAAFRLFDDRGRVLALRADGTIPTARLVANRFGDAPLPLRLFYFAHAYRAVDRGAAQSREFLQAGLELMGGPAPEGDAEIVSVVLEALGSAGLRRHRIGLGDASVYPLLLAQAGIPDAERATLLDHLRRRALPALEADVDRLGLSAATRELLLAPASLRGGPEVLERATGPLAVAVENLRAIHQLVVDRIGAEADRIIFDLGLVREMSYYTGTVFEVYDPAVGYALGGGGRYDDLCGRFGRDLPACGLALDVQRVHMAQLEEERLR